MAKEFDICPVIEKLRKKRKIFVSEADFQLEMAWAIKEEYPEAKIRLEFCPVFDPSIHLDILVVIDDKWYPIELKYKTKKSQKIVGGEAFYLKDQGARDLGMYLYLKDIERIERIRKNVPDFVAGYTMMITNDLRYMKEPRKKVNCHYEQFSLENGAVKRGEMRWSNESKIVEDEKLGKPITLDGEYKVDWKEYSKLDEQDTGTFVYVVNKIA